MPFCVVKRRRNHACFDVDFITTDSLGMDAVIGKALREFRLLLHFSEDTVTITKERYYRLLEIEAQYNAQQEEIRRLQQLLEEVIQRFEDDPKIIYFKEHLEKRLA